MPSLPFSAIHHFRHADLSSALAHRVVLPLDQKSSAHQTLLWNNTQRGEDSDLDRGGRLPYGRHPSQAVEPAGNIAQNFAAFERSPV